MIEREESGSVVILKLAHGKVSALDLELAEALDTLLGACADAGKAVIITGTGGTFSAGVDLYRLHRESEAYTHDFVQALSRLFYRVFELPVPVVAAVNGHAVAGGCVIACGADVRLMAAGKGRIGVPELRVGVPLPPIALEMVRSCTNTATLQRLVYGGDKLTPAEAQAVGIVDRVVPADALLGEAKRTAEKLMAIPPSSFCPTKRQIRMPYAERARACADATPGIWARDEVRKAISDYLQNTFGQRP